MSTGVYSITNLFDGKMYVGSSSTSIDKRWKSHRVLLRKRKHHNYRLQTAWCRCGEIAFEIDVLLECSPERCVEEEQHFIDALRPAYNICPTAGSRRGCPHSEEVRARMKGRPGYSPTADQREVMRRKMTGRKFSTETINRMRLAAAGRTISEEAKKKISKAGMGNKYNLGRKATDEARKNMALAQTGRKQTPESIEKTRLANIGRKISDETRAKMSASAKGHKRCVGRVYSAETKEKIRLGNLHRSPLPPWGRHTKETKAKLAEMRRGTKASDATRAKMRESRLRYFERIKNENNHVQ